MDNLFSSIRSVARLRRVRDSRFFFFFFFSSKRRIPPFQEKGSNKGIFIFITKRRISSLRVVIRSCILGQVLRGRGRSREETEELFRWLRY